MPADVQQVRLDRGSERAYLALLAARIRARRRAAAQAAAGRVLAPPATSLACAEEFRSFALPTPSFHRAWYAALDNLPSRFLYIQGPREHAKSSVALTHALKRILNERGVRIGVISKTGPAARDFMREVRVELEQNPRILALDRRFRSANPDRWNSEQLVMADAEITGKDATIWAVGMGGQITGRRADLLILDDIETLDTVRTDTRRAETRAWLAREAIPALGADGVAVAIGTPKHEDDVYHHTMLAPGSGWTALLNATDCLLPDGSPLWPEAWPLDALLERKTILDATDIRAWSQEYRGVIIPAETQMFRPESWPAFLLLPPGLRTFLGVDLAISERTSADYSCIAVYSVDADRRLYCRAIFRGRWTFHQTIESIKTVARHFNPELIGIEAVAYQSAAVQELIRTTSLPIKGVRYKQTAGGRSAGGTLGGDKQTRARLLEARAAAQAVLRPVLDEDGGVPRWWADYAAELAIFPEGRNDDQVDASVIATYLALRSAGAQDYRRAYGLDTCPTCGELFARSPDPARPRRCPFCSGQQRRWRPAPGPRPAGPVSAAAEDEIVIDLNTDADASALVA